MHHYAKQQSVCVHKNMSLASLEALACITGGIAEAFYDGVPEAISQAGRSYLPPELLAVVEAFRKEYRAG